MSAPSLLLRTLGTLQLERAGSAGAPEVVQRAGKPLALLAYLVAHEGRTVSRAVLADLLWGDEPGESARASLRQAVHTLRKLLGDAALTGDRTELGLAPDAVDSDHRHLLRAASRGDAAVMSEWYGGPFCAGLDLRGARAWEQWRDAERERLRRELLSVVRREVEARGTQGDVRGGAALARRLYLAEPALTEVVELAVDALGADGALDEARSILEAHRARLLAEGSEVPSGLAARLARLERARAGQPAAEPRRPADAGLSQRFVGREEVIATLFRGLERARGGETVTVAIVGPAGIGKSRVLDEFEARVRTRSIRVARVRFLPAMREIPYAALAEFARTLSALPGAMGIGEASASALVQLLPELRAQFPSAGVLAAPAEELPRVRAEAIADLLAAVSEDRLTVILRDDDQHVDQASRAVLETAFARRDLRLLDARTSRQMTDPGRGGSVLTLAPLTHDDVRRLLEAAGRLPDAPWVEDALAALLSGSAGIPQLLLQRLRALTDAGSLRFEDGRWSAPDPEALLRPSTPVTELGQLVGALRPEVRLAMELLALWRRPLRESDATAILGMLRRSPEGGGWRVSLAQLEERGLAVVRDDGWTFAHDTVAEACQAAMSPSERGPMLRACTRHLARSGALTVPTLEHLAALCGAWDQREEASRLVHAASRDRALRGVGVRGEALAARVAQAAGRPEWAPELAQRIAWIRRQSRGALLAYGTAAGIAAAALLWFLWMVRPRVVIEASPMAESLDDGGPRSAGLAVMVVQPRIALVDGFGRLLTSYDGQIRVRSPNRLIAGDSVIPVVKGRAQFERLGIRSLLPGVRVDSGDAVLEFSSGIARRARTTVDGAWGAGEKEQFRPVRIVVNGRDIASDAVVEAPLGDSLRFDLTFEYTTIMPTANYVVAAAPTWGNHPEGSIRLAGLPRPVRRAWQTVHFTVPSAPTPGLHHVIVLMGAEDSAEHLLSLTAWTRGLPVWNDGRDAQDMTLAQLDSLRLNNRVSLLKDAGSYRGKQSQVRLGDLAFDRTQPGLLISLPAQHFGTAVRIMFRDTLSAR